MDSPEDGSRRAERLICKDAVSDSFLESFGRDHLHCSKKAYQNLGALNL